MVKILGVIAVIVLSIGLDIKAQATPLICTSSSSLFGDDAIFARSEGAHGRFSIISWNSGETLRDMTTNITWREFYALSWSPDCGHLVVEIDNRTVVWDVFDNHQLGHIDTQVSVDPRIRTNLRINWSPDSRSLLLQTLTGAYLWNLNSGSYVRLTDHVDTYGRSVVSGSWRAESNQLFVVQVDSANGVSVYDLDTLEMTAFYHINGRRQPVRFGYEGTTIVVYSGNRAWGFPRNSLPGLSIWNTETQTSIQLDPNDPLFSLRDGYVFEEGPGYYIVSATGFRSSQKLYFWNKKQLIGSEPHIPNFVVNASAELFRVTESFVLEIVDWAYFGLTYDPFYVRLYRFDANDGQLIARTPSLMYTVACETDYSLEFEHLLELACENSDYDAPDYWGQNEMFIWPQ